jgi:hypothetical protein
LFCRSIAERFGLAKSTTHGCVMRVVKALLSLNETDKLITWPSLDKAAEIACDFEKSYGFPGLYLFVRLTGVQAIYKRCIH